MSDPRRPDLHDPKYGKVRELCEVLGYASDRKGSPRSMHCLRLKVTTFRKNFVESAKGIFFPLNYKSAEAQACASNFLERNERFFQDSMDAQAFGWPVLPRDMESLRDNLAKLMCTQEYLYRRNSNYHESRHKKDQEESEDSAFDESDSELSHDFEDPSNPAASRGATGKSGTFKRGNYTKEERNANNSKMIRENIEIHLNFTYPLDGTKDGKSSSWLFNSERCPQDIKPFVWRYLHERSLYTARKSTLSNVVLFARCLKHYLNITCTDAEDLVIRRRCEKMISNGARLWNVVGGYGFLVETDGIFKKTEQFEALWRDRRSKWISSVHDGNTTGVIELDRVPSTVTEGPEFSVGRKRGPGQADSATTKSFSDASTASATKRPKLTNFERTTNVSQTETSEFATGRGLYGTGSIDEEHIGIPRRMPEAPMISPVPNLPQPISKAVPVKSKELGKQQSSSANLNHPYPPSPSLSPLFRPDGSFARSAATLDDRLNMTPPSENRSTPYALNGASLNALFNVDTTLIKSAQLAPPRKPGKPKLRYILQNSRGVLDFDNALSNEIFRTSSISDFFNVVASRAGKSDGSLTCLTFVFNWGEREAFVVSRYGGDQYWEDMKERVKGTFLDARNSMKKRTKFELWIKCGDTTNLDAAEEDDDW